MGREKVTRRQKSIPRVLREKKKRAASKTVSKKKRSR